MYSELTDLHVPLVLVNDLAFWSPRQSLELVLS